MTTLYEGKAETGDIGFIYSAGASLSEEQKQPAASGTGTRTVIFSLGITSFSILN